MGTPDQDTAVGMQRPHDTVGKALAEYAARRAMAGQVTRLPKHACRAHYERMLEQQLRGGDSE